MSKSNLLKVAEGIMDSAIEDYRDINLESTESVQMYAENVLDIYLSDTDAKKVLDTCKAMVTREEAGDLIRYNDWYYDFEMKLSN